MRSDNEHPFTVSSCQLLFTPSKLSECMEQAFPKEDVALLVVKAICWFWINYKAKEINLIF